jgi:hypothetical protein
MAAAQKCSNFLRSCGIAHTPSHWIHPVLRPCFFPLPIRIEPHYNNNWFVGKSTKVDWSKWIFFSVVSTVVVVTEHSAKTPARIVWILAPSCCCSKYSLSIFHLFYQQVIYVMVDVVVQQELEPEQGWVKGLVLVPPRVQRRYGDFH